MPKTDKALYGFMVRVYQDGEKPPAIRVEFVPRGLQAIREPGGHPKPVPRFVARAWLDGKAIVASWVTPPWNGYAGYAEELKQEAAHRLAKRLAWLDRFSELVNKVDGWAQALGWSTKRVAKNLKDSEIGDYQTLALLLQEGTTRVLLEPVGSSAPGAEGVVDLYLLPAYDDIATLYYFDGRWNLHYTAPGTAAVGDMRDADSKPLSKTSLRKVLELMQQNVA